MMFYRDRLGLRLVGESPYALEFEAGERLLRVTQVEEVAPASSSDDESSSLLTQPARGEVVSLARGEVPFSFPPPLASGDIHELVFHGTQILFYDINRDGILHFDLILFTSIFGHSLKPLIATPRTTGPEQEFGQIHNHVI